MKYLFKLLIIFLFFSCELDPIYHTLSLSSSPTEGGILDPENGGKYEADSEITLQATSNSDFEFVSWSGSLSGSQNPTVIKMDRDKTIVANFKLRDTDGDGLSDAEDQCNNTPEGASVDNNGCIDTDEDGVSDSFNQNNFVPNVLVNKTINLNTPEGNPLLVPGGSAAFYDIGYKGVLVYALNESRFLAFDLACPHLDPSTCADAMDWKSSWPEIKCDCGEEEVIYYFLRPYANYKGRTYEMEAYKVIRVGNTLQIRNF